MSIQETIDGIIEDFAQFDEWMDKYEYIIDLGKELEPLPDSAKSEENLIKGCQSRVWLDYERDPRGNLLFKADSDAIITKGMISLLLKVVSGRSAADIMQVDFSFVKTIGLLDNLSQTRAGGLMSMIEKIKEIASKNI